MSMTAAQRSARAKKAATARHSKHPAFDWHNADLAVCEAEVARLRTEAERGSRIVQNRSTTAEQAAVKCEMCPTMIPNGRWVQIRVIRDPASQLQRNAFLCCQRCVTNYNSTPDHPYRPVPKNGKEKTQ